VQVPRPWCVPRQVSGQVDQSAGMLDEDAKEKGYALLCVSEPQSDCRIRVIDEVSLWLLLARLCAFLVLHHYRHRFVQTMKHNIDVMQDEIQEQMLCSSENV